MSRIYYNEFDKKKCAALKALMEDGHISYGDIDDRSIIDVSPDDLKGYTRCHFFAGIGVWDYALNLAQWPKDKEVWTGSCPCQDFSNAGKRKGMLGDRHLWPHWDKLIGKRKPLTVFGEQVEAAINFGWLDLVQTDMEGKNYAFTAKGIPAAGVGAPHIRQRLWFVADAAISGKRSGLRNQGSTEQRGIIASDGGGYDLMEYPARDGCREDGTGKPATRHDGVIRDGSAVVMANATMFGQQHQQNERSSELLREMVQPGRLGQQSGGMGAASSFMGQSEGLGRQQRGTESGGRSVAGGRSSGRLAHHHHQGPQGWSGMPERSGECTIRPDGVASGLAESYNTEGWSEIARRNDGIRSDAVRKESSSDAEGCSRDGRPSPLNGFWRDADWLFCRDGKWRPVKSGTFPLAYGYPERVGLLHCAGDAIVAQAAQVFIESFLDVENGYQFV